MNVLALSSYFDRDGVTSKTLAEAKSLAGLGVRLVIVVPCNPLARGTAVAALRAQGTTFHFAPTHFRVQNLLFPWALWRVGRLIRRERIDILSVSHRKALVLGAVLGRLLKVPLVYTVHGRSGGELPRRGREFWFRRVARVLPVSEESAAFFRSRILYPEEKMAIVRNGVDVGHYAPPSEPSAEARGERFDLLYLSRLDSDKMRAIQAVIAAAALAARERTALRLTIVGAGRRVGAVRSRAAAVNSALGREVVSVAGWVDDPQAFMARADVVLGAGRCVLEAAAAGRPVIVVGNDRLGGRLTAENFRMLQRTNFSGREASGAVSAAVSAMGLAELFRGPQATPEETEKVRALVLAGHDASRLAPEIKRLLEAAVLDPVPPAGPSVLSRLRSAAGLARRRMADPRRGQAKWDVLRGCDPLCLYAGNVPDAADYAKFTGLSLWKSDARHIRQDIRRRHGLPDGTVDLYQAEDVFEHIDRARLPGILADIFRILKPGGILRIAVPDYRSDVPADRSLRDRSGRIVFDPRGGGVLKRGRVAGGGHRWFPVYESVRELLEGSPFRDSFTFHHYYDEQGRAVLREIDYAIGYVKRTPDHDPRVRDPRRPLSIVVDAVKPCSPAAAAPGAAAGRPRR